MIKKHWQNMWANMMVRLLEYIVVKEDGQIVVILKGGIRCWRVMFKNT